MCPVGCLQNSTVVMATRLSTASRLRPPASIPAAAQQAPAVRSVVSMRVAQKAADPKPSTARDAGPLLDRPLSDRSRRTETKLAPKVKTLEELRKVGVVSANPGCCDQVIVVKFGHRMLLALSKVIVQTLKGINVWFRRSS